MKSILDNRPELHAAVWQVAETAGYLWEKGWAERNGGNITVNITEYVDDFMRSMPAICEPRAIGTTLPHLKDTWFYCKGTQKRMRDLANAPMQNGSIIRITDDCAHYEIVADHSIWGSFGLPQAIPGLAPTQARSPAPPPHPLPRRPSRMRMCARTHR